MEDYCSICGDELNSKYTHKLECGHTYHYECIMKTFQNTNNIHSKNCPYCRKNTGYLPIVKGLKKIVPGIHIDYISNIQPQQSEIIENNKCSFILTRGKNKGNQCSKYCFLGYDYCKIHYKKV